MTGLDSPKSNADLLHQSMAEVLPAASTPARIKQALHGLASAAMKSIPSADAASLTAFDKTGAAYTPMFTADFARRCDEVQHQAGEGSTLEAATAERWISVLATDLLNVRSVLSVSLLATALDEAPDSPAWGSDLYARKRNAFGEADRAVALWLGLYAS